MGYCSSDYGEICLVSSRYYDVTQSSGSHIMIVITRTSKYKTRIENESERGSRVELGIYKSLISGFRYIIKQHGVIYG
jgi:hypothetical protein